MIIHLNKIESMIQSNDTNIKNILDEIDCGKTQLPDFQRGWVWEDNRIRALIASISNGYPIGAAMFLDATGNKVRFKSRLFEGVDKKYETVVPNTLVLDGQMPLAKAHLIADKAENLIQEIYPESEVMIHLEPEL